VREFYNTIEPEKYNQPTRWSYADTDANDWKEHVIHDVPKP